MILIADDPMIAWAERTGHPPWGRDRGNGGNDHGAGDGLAPAEWRNGCHTRARNSGATRT